MTARRPRRHHLSIFLAGTVLLLAPGERSAPAGSEASPGPMADRLIAPSGSTALLTSPPRLVTARQLARGGSRTEFLVAAVAFTALAVRLAWVVYAGRRPSPRIPPWADSRVPTRAPPGLRLAVSP